MSGYVTSADREHLVFALEKNDSLHSSVKNVEDTVAVRLASYDATADAAHQRIQPQKEQTEPFVANDPRAALECSWAHTC